MVAMSEVIMLLAVILPVFTGILLPLLSFRSRRAMRIYLETAVCVNSGLVCLLLMDAPQRALTVFRFTHDLSITLGLDGMGAVYRGAGGIPLALCHAVFF